MSAEVIATVSRGEIWTIIGIVVAIQAATAGVVLGVSFWITRKITKDDENHGNIVRNQRLLALQMRCIQALSRESERTSAYLHFQVCQYAHGDFNENNKEDIAQVSGEAEHRMRIVINQIRLFSSDDSQRIDAARQLSQHYTHFSTIQLLKELIEIGGLSSEVEKDYKRCLNHLETILRAALRSRTATGGAEVV